MGKVSDERESAFAEVGREISFHPLVKENACSLVAGVKGTFCHLETLSACHLHHAEVTAVVLLGRGIYDGHLGKETDGGRPGKENVWATANVYSLSSAALVSEYGSYFWTVTCGGDRGLDHLHVRLHDCPTRHRAAYHGRSLHPHRDRLDSLHVALRARVDGSRLAASHARPFA